MAKSLFLVVKGSPANAKRAAARHGVALRNVRNASKSGKFHEVAGYAPCSALTKVMRWYGSKTGTNKAGRGFVPGTLLFFNHGSCSTTDLRGARRRRRR